jgi:hypothetical protein
VPSDRGTHTEPLARFEARSRWSLAVRCERMATYGLRGETPAEPDEYQLGFFERGKQLGAWMAERFVQKYGRDQVILEKAVAWPAGIAHTDIFVKPEKLAVEVKSTASLVPADFHILQLAGEVVFDDDAEQGALVQVNPSNLVTRTLPMPVVTDELRERVHEIAATVARAADPHSPLPGRVCARPSDAIGRMCPFAETCFTGWTAPDPVELEGELLELVPELDEAESTVKSLRAAVKEAEERRELVRARARRVLSPGTEYLARDDELVIGITEVSGRTTYDVASAIKLGVVAESALAPFRRTGKPSERWRVRPRPLLDSEQDAGSVLSGIAAAAAVEDFGDEAPWSSEDLG